MRQASAGMTRRVVVGVSDMRVSKNPRDELVTYSLGSCVGVAVYDPWARVGGLLHLLLCHSRLHEARQHLNPYQYADTGIPALFKAAYGLGARKQRMRVAVAGGARILDTNNRFAIGRQNREAAREILTRNGVSIAYADVGGRVSRTLYLQIASGDLVIKSTPTDRTVRGRTERITCFQSP